MKKLPKATCTFPTSYKFRRLRRGEVLCDGDLYNYRNPPSPTDDYWDPYTITTGSKFDPWPSGHWVAIRPL